MKNKPHSYEPGDKLWINKSIFKDAYGKSQASDRLISKGFGPFSITCSDSKNAVEVELPSHLRIHSVVNAMHTILYFEQSDEIAL